MDTISYHDLGLMLERFLGMHPSVIKHSIIGNSYTQCLDIEVIVDESKYVMDCLNDSSYNIKNHVDNCKGNLDNVYLQIISL